MRQKPGVPGYVVPEVRDKALETIIPGSLIKMSGAEDVSAGSAARGYDKEAIAVEKVNPGYGHH